jgi:phosphate transport system substrate-binding protein
MKLPSSIKTARGKLAIAALSVLSAALPLSAQTSLTGAGATFPAPIYQKWFADYQSIGNTQINYQANGSGGGIKAVTDGTADFGASDMPLSDEQLKAYQDKNGHGVLLFPTVLGAVVPVYNVTGVSAELNFPHAVLADIFLGKITTWNDPALVKANPGVTLPGEKIVVVHRSDGSGTTFCFTDFLAKSNPAWLTTVGKPNTTANWPAGLGAKGNDGIAGLIKQQSGSIGYVELIYAVKNKLTYGKVQNKAGQFVKAELSSVTAAAASMKEMPADFRVSITDAEGKAAYPISTFTWLLVPAQISDAGKKAAMVGFLKWALTKGQTEVESLDYAQLPKAVVAKEQKQIAMIK